MNPGHPIRPGKASTHAEAGTAEPDLDKPIRTDDPLIASEPGPVPTRWLIPPGRRSSRRVESAGRTRRSTPTLSWSPSKRRSRADVGRWRRSNTRKDNDERWAGTTATGTRHKQKHGQPSPAPSPTRILLYSGIVALVCGIVGALGYSYFFGSKSAVRAPRGTTPARARAPVRARAPIPRLRLQHRFQLEQRLRLPARTPIPGRAPAQTPTRRPVSARTRQEGRGRGQARRGGVGLAGRGEGAPSGPGGRRRRRGKSEEETKAILDFLKNTLLSAGRPGDASLADAFWAGGQGKDVTLHTGARCGRIEGRRGVRGPAGGRSKGPRDAGLGLPEPGRSGGGRQAVRARLGSAGGHAGTDPPRNGRLSQSTCHRVPACQLPTEAGPSV